MKHKQDGFAVLEALLVLVIIGMLAGIGWYVWHSTNQTNKTLNAASNQKIVPPITKKASANSQPYLTVKEWGVRALMPSNLTLVYSVDKNDPSHEIDVSSNELIASDSKNCGTVNSAGGNIYRFTGSEAVPAIFGSDTAAEAFKNLSTTPSPNEWSVKQTGKYYFFFWASKYGCSQDSPNYTDIQQKTVDSMLALSKSLEPVPQ